MILGKGFEEEEKTEKVWSRRVVKSQTSILEKYFFTEHVELI